MAQMSLEEFARIHHLDQTWIDLRQECNRLVEYQDFCIAENSVILFGD